MLRPYAMILHLSHVDALCPHLLREPIITRHFPVSRKANGHTFVHDPLLATVQ